MGFKKEFISDGGVGFNVEGSLSLLKGLWGQKKSLYWVDFKDRFAFALRGLRFEFFHVHAEFPFRYTFSECLRNIPLILNSLIQGSLFFSIKLS